MPLHCLRRCAILLKVQFRCLQMWDEKENN